MPECLLKVYTVSVNGSLGSSLSGWWIECSPFTHGVVGLTPTGSTCLIHLFYAVDQEFAYSLP